MKSSLLALALCVAPTVTVVTVTPQRLAWMREAEKKHARVALVALPSLAVLGAAGVEHPVNWLNSQPAETQLYFYSVAAVLESLNLRRFGPGLTLKDTEIPGKLFGDREPSAVADAFEDTLGRAAMVMVAGAIVAEAVGGL
jgi:hypothetical protein